MEDDHLSTTEQLEAAYVHPFQEGWRAREDGKDEYDNPHASGTWQWNAWQHGWDEGEEYFEKGSGE